MNFIELTNTDGSKFIGNINLLKRVFICSSGYTVVSGWNSNGYIEVKESYDEVIAKIKTFTLAGVNRLQSK